MKQTTEAIVLGLRKHSDKLSVLHVYTKAEGRLALHVYGAQGKHKVKAAYQPLSVVELTYDSQPTRPVATLSAIDPVYLPEQVYSDIRKQTIALFVAELLLLTFTHPQQDTQTYDFLDDFVHELNGTSIPENMHIQFMIHLAELLGIGTPNAMDGGVAQTAALSRKSRQEILHRLCEYYLTHIDSFKMPKSLDILTEVFN